MPVVMGAMVCVCRADARVCVRARVHVRACVHVCLCVCVCARVRVSLSAKNMAHWKATKVTTGVQCYMSSGTTSSLPSARGDGVVPYPPRYDPVKGWVGLLLLPPRLTVATSVSVACRCCKCMRRAPVATLVALSTLFVGWY